MQALVTIKAVFGANTQAGYAIVGQLETWLEKMEMGELQSKVLN